MRKNNKKGFTLVELVIVVAVMAVLVAVAIPTVASIVGTAEDSVAKSNARTIESVIKLAEANNTDGDTELSAEEVAKAVYEAKLGIDGDSKVFVFYYDPTSGNVKPVDATTNVGWKIEFGKATKDSKTYEGAVQVTPTTSAGALDTTSAKCSPEGSFTAYTAPTT